jgi:segregation and condensation protein A
MGAIVTFLAILEMVKESLIDIIQNEDFSIIYLQTKTS